MQTQIRQKTKFSNKRFAEKMTEDHKRSHHSKKSILINLGIALCNKTGKLKHFSKPQHIRDAENALDTMIK